MRIRRISDFAAANFPLFRQFYFYQKVIGGTTLIK